MSHDLPKPKKCESSHNKEAVAIDFLDGMAQIAGDMWKKSTVTEEVKDTAKRATQEAKRWMKLIGSMNEGQRASVSTMSRMFKDDAAGDVYNHIG